VRELARQVAEIADSPVNAQRKKRWRDVNALRKPDRAPVWCKPVGAWSELLPESELDCADPYLRNWERRLRRILVKADIGDDSPLESYFEVQASFDVRPANTWGVEVGRERPDAAGGAWAYDPPLRSAEDFEKLRIPSYVYDESRTREDLERARGLLGDIMPVRLVCGPCMSGTIGNYAADLRGLTQMMMDVAMAPELTHRLMAYMRDAVVAANEYVEGTGLLTRNNTGAMTCSDPFGPEPQDGRIGLRNLWIMANSQEFDQVSPTMWEEFCLNYQKPIFEQFGLVGYGCCENLTRKIDGVLSIPNLRIFVSSAWTDLEAVIERVGSDYVIMWRQKASDVVFTDDDERLRQDLRGGMRRLRGCYVQIVLRELQTLDGHTDRLHKWTRFAIEAAEEYS